MARKLKAAAAQLGPIHLADTRGQVVGRLIELMREAAAGGVQARGVSRARPHHLFPRYWYDDLAEAGPLLRAGDAGAGDGAALRGGEASRGRLPPRLCGAWSRRRAAGGCAGSTPPSSSARTGRSSASTGRSTFPDMPTTGPNIPFQHLEKRYFEVGDLGFPVCRGVRRHPSEWRSATTAAGRRRSGCSASRGSRWSSSGTTRRPSTSTTPRRRTFAPCTTTSRSRPARTRTGPGWWGLPRAGRKMGTS